MMWIPRRASCQVMLVCVLLFSHASSSLASNLDDNSAAEARKLLDLSAQQNLSNHSLARETAAQALNLYMKLGDAAGITTAHASIAQYQLALGNLVEAKKDYELVLQSWRRQNNTPGQVDALIYLGFIEQKKGEWLNAFSYLSQAQALLKDQTSLYDLARIAASFADFFMENGMLDGALMQYQRALDYFAQKGDTRGVNRMVMFIGYVHFLRGDNVAALSNLQQALNSFDRKVPTDLALCYEYLAQFHLAKKEYGVALQYLEPSLTIYENGKNLIETARVQALIAQVYEQQNLLVRARTRYLRSLETYRSVKDRVNEAALCFAIGRLELKNGNLDQAEHYLRESIENTEEIRSISIGRDVSTAISANVHKRYSVYIDCLLRKHKLQPTQGWDARAFEASELARARSLAEFLRDTQTNLLSGVDPLLVKEEKNLRQLIRAKVDRRISLLAREYEEKDLNELERSLVELREQHQNVEQKIRKLSPAYHQLSQPTTYSLADVQKQIVEDDDTALLEYILGEETSYAWVVTRNSARVVPLPNEASIEDAVRAVYELLSKRPDSQTDARLKEASADLARMILTPVAGELKGRRLIVVADGALNYIPFQLLPNPSGNQEPLIASYEVVNVPSASVLNQLRHENISRGPRDMLLAAFGDPVFPRKQPGDEPVGDLATATMRVQSWQGAMRNIELTGDAIDPSNVEPLLYAKLELDALKEIAGVQSFVATGLNASRETFEKTDLSKYAILHLATHGYLDPKRPEFSGFFLSMVDANQHKLNGFMTVQDVYNLRAPVDLVVLSACRTALGKDIRGEGLIGLTRGFMHAGASSVAASLWSVDDEATAELMKNFYDNMLHKRMTPAAALRAAQNTIRQNPLWQSPHYWAAFTLQGEYKQTIRIPPTPGASQTVQTIVGSGMMLALLAGIGWGYWRRRGH